MQLTEKAAKGAKWTALTSGANALIAIAQISIVARFLEPNDFGAVAIILVVIAIANVFVTVGFSDVLVVKHAPTREQLSTLYWLNIFVGLVAYGALFVSAPLLSLFVDRDGIETMARVMGLTLFMGSTVVQFNALMRRELYLKAVAVISLAAHFIGFLIAVIMAITGFGVWSLIIAGLASQLTTNVILMTYAAKHNWYPQKNFNISSVEEIVRFGAYRIGSELLHTFNTKTDQLAIGAFLGTNALGIYTIAYNLAMQPFSRINPILTQVSFPVFAKIKNDNAKLLRGYRKGLRLLMSINAPLLIGLIVIAPLLIPALVGPGWEESTPVLQILCLFVLLRSAANINIGLVLAKEKYRWPLYWIVFLVLVMPPTYFVTARLTNSLIAVSWAVVGIQVLLSVMSYILFARRLLGGFALSYLSDFGRPVITATLMGLGVFWLQSKFLFSSHWLGLAVMVSAGALLYIALSLILQPKHMSELIDLAKAKM